MGRQLKRTLIFLFFILIAELVFSAIDMNLQHSLVVDKENEIADNPEAQTTGTLKVVNNSDKLINCSIYNTTITETTISTNTTTEIYESVDYNNTINSTYANSGSLNSSDYSKLESIDSDHISLDSEFIEETGHFKGVETFRYETTGAFPSNWAYKTYAAGSNTMVVSDSEGTHNKIFKITDTSTLYSKFPYISSATFGNASFGTWFETWLYLSDPTKLTKFGLCYNDGWVAGGVFIGDIGFDNNLVYMNSITLGGISGGWQKIHIDIDYSALQLTLTINGTNLGTTAFMGANATFNRFYTYTGDTDQSFYYCLDSVSWDNGTYIQDDLADLEGYNQLNVTCQFNLSGIDRENLQSLNVSINSMSNISQDIDYSIYNTYTDSHDSIASLNNTSFYHFNFNDSIHEGMYFDTNLLLNISIYGYNTSNSFAVILDYIFLNLSYFVFQNTTITYENITILTPHYYSDLISPYTYISFDIDYGNYSVYYTTFSGTILSNYTFTFPDDPVINYTDPDYDDEDIVIECWGVRYYRAINDLTTLTFIITCDTPLYQTDIVITEMRNTSYISQFFTTPIYVDGGAMGFEISIRFNSFYAIDSLYRYSPHLLFNSSFEKILPLDDTLSGWIYLEKLISNPFDEDFFVYTYTDFGPNFVIDETYLLQANQMTAFTAETTGLALSSDYDGVHIYTDYLGTNYYSYGGQFLDAFGYINDVVDLGDIINEIKIDYTANETIDYSQVYVWVNGTYTDGTSQFIVNKTFSAESQSFYAYDYYYNPLDDHCYNFTAYLKLRLTGETIDQYNFDWDGGNYPKTIVWNVSDAYDDLFYPKDLIINIYDSSGLGIEFEKLKTYINGTRVSQQTKAPSSTIEIAIFDYLNNEVYNSTHTYSPEINININYYRLVIKNLMRQETNITINSTYSFELLEYDSESVYLKSGVYNISWIDDSNISQQILFNLINNAAIPLNTTYHLIYFSLFDSSGLGILGETVKFYINGIRNEVGPCYVRGATFLLTITDFLNSVLYNTTIPWADEIDILIDVYTMFIHHNYTETMQMKIYREDVPYTIFEQDVNPWSPIEFRFLAGKNYTIDLWWKNGTLAETKTIELNETKAINFGFYKENFDGEKIWENYFWFGIFALFIVSTMIVLYFRAKRNLLQYDGAKPKRKKQKNRKVRDDSDLW